MYQMQYNIWSCLWLLLNDNWTLFIILIDSNLILWGLAVVSRSMWWVCSMLCWSRRPWQQLRSGDEMETAGEEGTLRDGWTQRWKAFSNCANFRPHMSLNLSKPVHSMSPLASINPPLCVCVCVWECLFVGPYTADHFCVCLRQLECINKQYKEHKWFPSTANSVTVLKFHFLRKSFIVSISSSEAGSKVHELVAASVKKKAACAHQDMTYRPCFSAKTFCLLPEGKLE